MKNSSCDGCPLKIVSDRGGSFLAEVFRKFENLQSIRHLASTPYHPQTNDLVERMHRTLNHAITTLSHSNPERWDEFLLQAVFSLRVRTHAVTGYSPFYLLYGVEPRLPGDKSPFDSFLAPLDEFERREQRLEFTARELDHLGQIELPLTTGLSLKRNEWSVALVWRLALLTTTSLSVIWSNSSISPELNSSFVGKVRILLLNLDFPVLIGLCLPMVVGWTLPTTNMTWLPGLRILLKINLISMMAPLALCSLLCRLNLLHLPPLPLRLLLHLPWKGQSDNSTWIFIGCLWTSDFGLASDCLWIVIERCAFRLYLAFCLLFLFF